MAVGARANRPQLAHLLWVLVLAKLLTPPMVSIPMDGFSPLRVRTPSASTVDGAVLEMPAAAHLRGSLFEQASAVLRVAAPWLTVTWLAGSGCVLAWSLLRGLRFNRLLQVQTNAAPRELVATAAELAERLGLKWVPTIHTTTASISPMVWWFGGPVRVVIPATLLQQMKPRELRWVLAHELAHLRRRDHVVRWLEWLAICAFWWNPIAWWAQRNLRAMEEICCDDLVISQLGAEPRQYAGSILFAIESLASPVLRPPAIASGVNSGGTLEWRFMMMVGNRIGRTESRWLRACVLIGASLVLPLGVAYGQDYEAVGERLRAAVEAKELTGAQARFMLGALRLGESLSGPQEERITRKDFAAAEAKMRAMVERGEVSKEDVQTRLSQMRQMMARQRGKEKVEQKVDWEPIKQRIEGAVKRGDLTREEADAKYREIKEGIKERRRLASQEDHGERQFTREEYAAAEARMRAMVERGEVPKEAVEMRLGQMRQMMAQQPKKEKAEQKVDWKAIKMRIEGAVERGDLTREEADKKYTEIRIRSADKSDSDKLNWDVIQWRIESAVKSGEMTREQADATYRALKR